MASTPEEPEEEELGEGPGEDPEEDPRQVGAGDALEATPGDAADGAAGGSSAGGLFTDTEAGYDFRIPGMEPGEEGVGPTARERLETGMQDTLDLRDWKMPSLRDYLWYLVVYTTLIALAVHVIWRYRMLWAYVLWGGYLVTLLVLSWLMLRSLRYRRGTFSKSYLLSTLDLQQAVEDALDDVGLQVARVERPRGVVLRPMLAVYRLMGRGYTVNIEGRPHLKRKVVRVGRFRSPAVLEEGRSVCHALDQRVDIICEGKRRRTLFREETC